GARRAGVVSDADGDCEPASLGCRAGAASGSEGAQARESSAVCARAGRRLARAGLRDEPLATLGPDWAIPARLAVEATARLRRARPTARARPAFGQAMDLGGRFTYARRLAGRAARHASVR